MCLDISSNRWPYWTNQLLLVVVCFQGLKPDWCYNANVKIGFNVLAWMKTKKKYYWIQLCWSVIGQEKMVSVSRLTVASLTKRPSIYGPDRSKISHSIGRADGNLVTNWKWTNKLKIISNKKKIQLDLNAFSIKFFCCCYKL